MFADIERILAEACQLTKDRHVVVGVSGGADSLSLLDAILGCGYKVIVAHVNHKLRSEADSDANAVERLAARLNLLSAIEVVDVSAFARENSMSIEEAAREVRYRALFSIARKYRAQAVAVGHTADDQVETVLMHFLQGAGLAGLKGMSYRTLLPNFDAQIPLIRPLLDVWREDTVVYCAMHRLNPREDSTNTDLSYLRNRIRHLLIPTLETYNPRFRESAWRTSQILAGDYLVLNEIVDDAWETVVSAGGDGYLAFDAARMAALPAGLQRGLLRRACRSLCETWRDMNFETMSRITAFIASPDAHRPLDLPHGLRLFFEDGKLYLGSRDANPPGDWPRVPDQILPVSVPGQIGLPGGWTLFAEPWEIPALAREQLQKNDDPYHAWLDADQLTGPLTLRPRQPGDRFEPLGMGGNSVKLTDFFINVKAPRRARETWPLLFSGDALVWIPGYRLSHLFRVSESTRRVLHLRLVKMRAD